MRAPRRVIPTLILVLGLGLLYPMQRSIDQTSPRATISDEALFFSSGKNIKKMSLGLEALAADIYWIRTVQYFGRKLIDSGKPLSSASARPEVCEHLISNFILIRDPMKNCI